MLRCFDSLNDSDFQIYLKHQLNLCFINNFFEESLQAWQANIDIQPVFNNTHLLVICVLIFLKLRMKHQRL